jgi:hypothetical protein
MIIYQPRSRKRLIKHIIKWIGIALLVAGLALGTWFFGRAELEKWERR